MFDINRHRFFLVQLLKDIYSDFELAANLGFKGGTALMFFYGLPRFSTDLDFNLLDPGMEGPVYRKVRKILEKYGSISDEARKFHEPLLVLDYGSGERKLKVEISNRIFDDRYEIRALIGIEVRVMAAEDMFAHKLCALLDRGTLANRDIFDCWFFMNRRTPVNRPIVESRMDLSLEEYLQRCIARISRPSRRGLLDGLGELLDPDMKKFVKNELKQEVLRLFELYKTYPIS
jgi:predicted nucleotidyltransferase component of viral defense system